MKVRKHTFNGDASDFSYEVIEATEAEIEQLLSGDRKLGGAFIEANAEIVETVDHERRISE